MQHLLCKEDDSPGIVCVILLAQSDLHVINATGPSPAVSPTSPCRWQQEAVEASVVHHVAAVHQQPFQGTQHASRGPGLQSRALLYAGERQAVTTNACKFNPIYKSSKGTCITFNVN